MLTISPYINVSVVILFVQAYFLVESSEKAHGNDIP